MNQTEVTLPSGSFLMVEVPEGAKGIYFSREICSVGYFVDDELNGWDNQWLPLHNWELLGADPTRLTEEEAGEIVECLCRPVLSGIISGVYKNYNLTKERTGWSRLTDKKRKLVKLPIHPDTATASLDSLAAANGIKKPFVILKKK